MDFEEEKGAFEIENKNESEIIRDNEIGNPPLIVVIQGGKNVML